MCKNIGFVIKMIDRNNILIHRIIYIWNVLMTFFFGDGDVLKITHGIISDIAENAVVDELEGFFRLGFETLGELMNDIGNADVVFYFCDELAAIRKILSDNFVFHFYRRNRVAADVRKTVIGCVIIAAFQ